MPSGRGERLETATRLAHRLDQHSALFKALGLQKRFIDVGEPRDEQVNALDLPRQATRPAIIEQHFERSKLEACALEALESALETYSQLAWLNGHGTAESSAYRRERHTVTE